MRCIHYKEQPVNYVQETSSCKKFYVAENTLWKKLKCC